MKINKLTIVQVAVAVLLAVMIAVVLLSGNFFQEAVILPVYYIFWLMGNLIRSIDQSIIWSVLVLVVVIIGGNIFIFQTQGSVDRAPEEDTNGSTGRIAHWTTYTRLMQANARSENFFIDEARNLLVDILASQYHLTRNDAIDQIHEREIPIPNDIYDYFFARKHYALPDRGSLGARLVDWLREVFQRGPDQHAVDRKKKLDRIIHYLEEVSR
jgi:hypothetical protein